MLFESFGPKELLFHPTEAVSPGMNGVAYTLDRFALIVRAQFAANTMHSILYLLQVIVLEGALIQISSSIFNVGSRTLPPARDSSFGILLQNELVLLHLRAGPL